MFATELGVKHKLGTKRACEARTASLMLIVLQQIKALMEAPLKTLIRVKGTVGRSPKTCTLLFD